MGSLAEYLKEIREGQGLSLRAASQKLGISDAYLCILETQRHPRSKKASDPSPTVLRKIAEGYGISYPKLLELAGILPEGIPAKVLEVLADERNRSTVALMAESGDLDELVGLIGRELSQRRRGGKDKQTKSSGQE